MALFPCGVRSKATLARTAAWSGALRISSVSHSNTQRESFELFDPNVHPMSALGVKAQSEN